MSVDLERLRLAFKWGGSRPESPLHLSWEDIDAAVEEILSLRAECERLRAACRLYREASLQGHSAHWDYTGQHGAGCEECIRARKLRDLADEARSAAAKGGEHE